jgi:hypothetical protein
MSLCGLPFTITPSIQAQANFKLSQVMESQGMEATIYLANFSVWVKLTASASFTIPIFGVDLGPLGYLGIALTASFTVTVGMGLYFSESPSAPLFLGVLPVLLQSIEVEIGLSASVSIGISVVVASLSVGGTLTFDIYLESQGPLVKGMILTGAVWVSVGFLFWTWSTNLYSGTIWEEGNPSEIISRALAGNGSTNDSFVVGSRYYNTTGYETTVWSPGAWNGTLVNDAYPQGAYDVAQAGNQTLLVYASDNVSMSRATGLGLRFMDIDPAKRSTSTSAVPATSNEITFDPKLLTLPDGSVMALWGALSDAKATTAASPSDISSYGLQTSTYDPATKAWGPVDTLPTTGLPVSYMASSCGSDTRVLYLETSSAFARQGNLIEYDVPAGIAVDNVAVSNVDNIVSYDCSSNLVALQYYDGSYAALNLTTGSFWSIRAMAGATLQGLTGVQGAPGELALLFKSNDSSFVEIYDTGTDAQLAQMTLGEEVASIDVVLSGGSYVVAAMDNAGVELYLLTGFNSISLGNLPWKGVVSDKLTVGNGMATVVGETQSGSSSSPLRDILTAFVPVVGVSAITATPATADIGTPITFSAQPLSASPPENYQWTGLPSGCVSQDTPILTCTPTAAGNYLVQLSMTDSRGYSAQSPVLNLTVRAPLAITAMNVTPAKLSAGGTLKLTSAITGGSGGTTYTWTGLPPGCFTENVPAFTCAPAAAGNYTIGLTVNDTSGASTSSHEVQVEVIPPLEMTSFYASSTNVQTGTAVMFTSGVEGGAGPYTYRWMSSPPVCAGTSTSTMSCTFNRSGTYLVTLEVTDSGGSSVSGSVQITVGAPQSAPSYTMLYILLAGAGVLLVANVVIWWWPKRSNKEGK